MVGRSALDRAPEWCEISPHRAPHPDRRAVVPAFGEAVVSMAVSFAIIRRSSVALAGLGLAVGALTGTGPAQASAHQSGGGMTPAIGANPHYRLAGQANPAAPVPTDCSTKRAWRSTSTTGVLRQLACRLCKRSCAILLK